MRVLICGDRNWTNYAMVKAAISYLNPDLVIEGVASGADIMAEQVAKELQINYLGVPAKWYRYGRSAGPIRNREMLELGKPDLVIAFNNHIEASSGTADMLQQTEKKGIPYCLFTEED